jgi:hypothetical protein
LDTLFEGRLAEVHQQANPQFHDPQICQSLFDMNGRYSLNRLDLNEKTPVYDHVRPKGVFNYDSVVAQGNRHLTPYRVAAPLDGAKQQQFVSALKQSRSQISMNPKTAVNGIGAELVEFHFESPNWDFRSFFLAVPAKSLSQIKFRKESILEGLALPSKRDCLRVFLSSRETAFGAKRSTF